MTRLQRTFHVNMLALVDGIQPRVLTLKMVLEEYVKHREVSAAAAVRARRGQSPRHILKGLLPWRTSTKSSHH